MPDGGVPAPPAVGRPGHLLDILGEVGAFRVRQDRWYADRDDGTGPGLLVPVVLAHLFHDAVRRHGVAVGREDTWALLMLRCLAGVCMETDPDLIRIELTQLMATGAAWTEHLDRRPVHDG